MNSVIIDFEKRVAEINTFFVLIENFEEGNAKLLFPESEEEREVQPSTELIKVLKASMFLLLYNLVESSIKQSITEIYDSISGHQVQYKNVVDEIKKLWILEKHSNFKRIGTDKIFETMAQLADEIIELKFDSEKLISGNIDGRKIGEFSKKFGFLAAPASHPNKGVKLHLVKTQRNNLAHGISSFSECGRNYSVTELRQIKTEVIEFLKIILENITSYVADKKFVVNVAHA